MYVPYHIVDTEVCNMELTYTCTRSCRSCFDAIDANQHMGVEYMFMLVEIASVPLRSLE